MAPRALSTAWALLRKEARLATSYRGEFVTKYLLELVFLGMFYFIARLFAGTAPGALAEYGGDYLSFLIVGVAFAAYLRVSLQAFTTSFREQQAAGLLEPLLLTPNPAWLLVGGSAAWSLVEGLLVLALYLGAGGLLLGADFSRADWLAAAVVIALALVILTAWAVAAAAVLLLFRRFDPVRWLATAASILAGVFFPVSVLPEPLRLLAYLLPLTYALDALRAALLLGRPLAALGTPLLALGLFALALVPGSLALASYAVRVLRRQAGVGLA